MFTSNASFKYVEVLVLNPNVEEVCQELLHCQDQLLPQMVIAMVLLSHQQLTGRKGMVLFIKGFQIFLSSEIILDTFFNIWTNLKVLVLDKHY